jgi:uncharacterized damage-inducible protein DinB
MSNPISDRYRRWFEYEKDAHAKVLASLGTVTAERRAEPAFQKATSILGHMVAARRMWLFRLGGNSERPRELFPQAVTISELKSQFEQMHSLWTNYLAKLSDADLQRLFEYKTTEGEPFCNTVEDVLMQLHGHSLYHRGQIATLIRTAGGNPAETDFIFWCRKPR